MRLVEAITSFTGLALSDCTDLLNMLTQRETEAIFEESRLDEPFWHKVFQELASLVGSPTAATDNDVRLAISAALEDAILIGPPPDSLSGPCERAASFSGMVGYYARELFLNPSAIEDHIDAWADPSAKNALAACKGLLGHLTTGRNPSWAIPYAHGDPHPLDGLSAGICHQRLALYPEIDDAAKLIMTYTLPSGTTQTIPTIGDAYRWNDDRPHWRSFFLPSPAGTSPGRTGPLDSGLDGFPEIVHAPVRLDYLIRPLQKRS
jgi:hypothetical protein